MSSKRKCPGQETVPLQETIPVKETVPSRGTLFELKETMVYFRKRG